MVPQLGAIRRMEGRLTLLLWAVGANVAVTIAIVSILVTISRQLDRIGAQLARISH